MLRHCRARRQCALRRRQQHATQRVPDQDIVTGGRKPHDADLEARPDLIKTLERGRRPKLLVLVLAGRSLRSSGRPDTGERPMP